jgi:catechol 2,3-dioxygenase-like lactoylglutathione lyase family enzyme
MFNSISHSGLYVLDQDAALEFYVGKLGLEVSADIDMGFMRWLTVSVPGEHSRSLVLQVPELPGSDAATAEQVRELLTKGAAGGWFILTVDDCRATYEDLLAKGVEFTQEPTEYFYGIDCGMRDPFGNHIRFTQPAEGEIKMPEPGQFA